MSLTIASILAESAARHPDRTAVVLGDLRLTYAQLWGHALQYAAVLRDKGVGPGDKVAMLLPNTPHFPLTYFGTLALGAVAVPVHALLKAEEIQYVLEDSGAKVLVCAAPLLGEGAKGAELAGIPVLAVMDGGDAVTTGGLERIDTAALSATPVEAMVPREPEDTAVILYTSGTTGTPKGAEITHLNVTMNVLASATYSFDITEDDVVLGCLPLFHTFGQTCCMNTAFFVGASVVLLPRFDGAQALELLEKEKLHDLHGRPDDVRRAARGGQDLRPPPEAEVGAVRRRGPARPGARAVRRGLRHPGARGLRPHRDLAGRHLQPGRLPAQARHRRQGDLGRRGRGRSGRGRGRDRAAADRRARRDRRARPQRVQGLPQQARRDAAAIVDGWFRTGDLGTKDDDGYVSIVDRKKDMVIRGGYNIYPREVEEALLRHPAVGQVAVIGLPDPQYGEEVCAVVVLDPAGGEVSEQELSAWSKTKLAAYKYPRRVIFTDAFPLGPSGKVLKRELVEQYKE